jgi:hypothetical protein
MFMMISTTDHEVDTRDTVFVFRCAGIAPAEVETPRQVKTVFVDPRDAILLEW